MKLCFLMVILCSCVFSQQALEKISLQLHWLDQFQFAGYYMAKEKGFYSKASLDVTFKKFDLAMNVAEQVSSNKATYGIGNTELIVEKSNGKNIVLLASILQTSPQAFISNRESNINNIEDFEGKRIVMSRENLSPISLYALLKSKSISLDNIRLQKYGQKIKNFMQGYADVINVYASDQTYVLDQLGIKYNIFKPKDYGFDFYSDILFTSQNEETKYPQRMQRFKEASLHGWEYAFSHINESVELILAKYNTQNKTREALFYEANELKKLAYNSSANLGSIDINKIQRIYDIYNLMGLITTPIDINKFVMKVKKTIIFNDEETRWLMRHPTLTYSEINWRPLSIIENQTMTGIMGDYLDVIAQRTGIQFQYIPSTSWTHVQELFKEKKIDFIPTTLQEKNLGLLSDNYKSYPMVIITGKSYKFIEKLNELDYKTIAVPKEYTSHKFLLENFPKIKLKITQTIEEALMLVQEGKAEAFVGHIATSLYYIAKLHLSDLKISGRCTVNFNHNYFIQPEYPEFLSIVNKVFASMSEEEKAKIDSKWINTKIETRVDYTLLKQFFAIFIFTLGLVLFFMLKQNQLKQEIIKINESLKKQVQEEVAKNRKKDTKLAEHARLAKAAEMLSMIAHQWRQPISAISATSLALEFKASTGEADCAFVEKKAQLISTYTSFLSATIDDFRNFFKSNREKENTTYTEIIESVLKISSGAITHANINLITHLSCDTIFQSYKNELKQVVLNLLKNAQDALAESKRENPYIKIKTYNLNNAYILEVSDNGGGIPEEIITKVFDPYFSTKDEKTGTGIGLYMSKIIIEDHCKGTLIVKNHADGAMFTITLNSK